jgi:amino acid permease
MMTCMMHVFCAVVGAGVLALPYSVSWLGWVAGPILIIVFYLFSMLSSILLASLYEVNGVEHGRYHHVVNHILGKRQAIWASVFQLANIFLTMVAYTITGASALVAIAQIAYEYEGVEYSEQTFAPQNGGVWKMTLLFGAAELFLSQVPSLEEAWWVSVLGTLGSLIYALIALILGLANASNNEGTVGGQSSSPANKAFNILNALGAIGFAFNFSLILPEIQDTLKQPPSAIRTMKTVCAFSVTGCFVFYFMISVAGYAALGNDVQPIILDSFCGPNWALLLAQIAILLHMLTAYQVFGQAMFNTLESHVKWWLLRREAKQAASGVPETILEGEEEEEEEQEEGGEGSAGEVAVKKKLQPQPPTPFETRKSNLEKGTSHDTHYHNIYGFDHIKLEPIGERLSSTISGEILPGRRSSLMQQMMHVHEDKSHTDQKSFTSKLHLEKFKMYSADTGFAVEEVPLNDEGYVLPFWYRLVIRSLYSMLMTLLACIMPFFSAFAGLVGAVTYFPLAIYFPFTCYRKVFMVQGNFNRLLWGIYGFTLLVAVGATIGSVRTIIVGWSTYQVFGGNEAVSNCKDGT